MSSDDSLQIFSLQFTCTSCGEDLSIEGQVNQDEDFFGIEEDVVLQQHREIKLPCKLLNRNCIFKKDSFIKKYHPCKDLSSGQITSWEADSEPDEQILTSTT